MTDRPLTSRETEAIEHVMEGTRMVAVAHKMGCKERTVRFHLDNARHKLGAKNLAHAVAIFMAAEMLKRESV